ncbi:MAG: PAS domain S-box protein [Acidimicrobiales bacterium]
MLEFAPDGMIVAAESGEIVYANSNAAALFRSTVDALVGRTVEDLLPEDLRGAHRAHRNRYRAHPTVRTMGAGLLLAARRDDGTEFHAEISLSPLPTDGHAFVVAAVRDISERVVAEDHLRRVLHTLDVSDDGIFMFDAETLQFAHVNDGAERLVGYPRAELLTMTPVHLNPYTSEEQYHELVAELVAHPDRAVRRETSLMRSDGLEVPVEKTYRAGPVGRDGSRWVVSMARDITARLSAEAELLANQQALLEAERIVLLVEDRERIARDLHDTVIQRLFAAGLGLQSILRAADDVVRPRLERTIDELDETIRELRSAIFSLGTSNPTMGGLRGRMLDAINEICAVSSVESRVQFDGPIETLDQAVGDQLVPIVREAVTNAVKHGSPSNVRVSVTVGDDVSVTVADDGAGLTGEVLGGRGLINLNERAVALGGSSTLAPLPNGGCEFEWRVPLSADAPTST